MKNVYVLALLAYFAFSICDVAIKAVGGAELSVFEIGLIVNICAAAVLLFTRHPHEKWRDFWKMDKSLIVHARAICGVVASICSIYAFTTIPLTQAYALIFLSPIFVTTLSAIFLKEPVGIWRWSAVLLGFLGVLLVLRPSVQPIELGHLCAIGTGFTMSISIIILRGAGNRVKRTSMLGMLLLYLFIFNLGGMLIRGAHVPSAWQLMFLVVAGVSFALGQWTYLMAARQGNANQIAPLHYSQLIWAGIFGAWFFAEYPDKTSLLGMAVIAASGLVTLLREAVLQRLSAEAR